MISDNTSQIATATEEQSVVADQVNQSIHVIDDISKENTQSATEVNETSIAIQDNAKSLEMLSSTFR